MRNSYWWAYKFFVLFLMMTSFQAWMFWALDENIYFWICAFIASMVFMFINNRHYNLGKHNRGLVWFILLQITLFFNKGDLNINGLLTILIPTWSSFSVFMLKEDSKTDLFDTVYKSLSVVLLISFAAWLLFLIGVPFPYSMEAHGIDDLYYFENYRFFLRNTTMLSDLFFPRFCSIFLEPGYLGCIISLLLFIRRYKMDFWGIVYLVCLIATFSLAGWIISAIGYLAYRSFHARRPVLMVLSIVVAFVAFWGVAKSINGGNNMLNMAIFERLEYNQDTGTIAGYDRSTEGTDQWFWSTFVKSPDVVFGSSSAAAAELKINDNDWKSYIVKHGIVGLSFFLLFAFFPLNTSKKNKECHRILLILCIIFVLIFAQTIHLIFSVMYIVALVLGDSVIRLSYTRYNKFNTIVKQ